MEMIVRSRRGALVARFVMFAVVGVTLGWIVENLGFIERSPLGKMSEVTGMRVPFLLVAGLWTMGGLLSLLEGWNHRVVLDDRGIEVTDAQGSYFIAYDNVALVRKMGLGTVGIAVRDHGRWAATIIGKPADVQKRLHAAAVLQKSPFQVDVQLHDRHLDIGRDAFMAEVERRMPAPQTYSTAPIDG